MYDNEMHNGLEDKELRDFFSKSMYEAYWHRKSRKSEIRRREDDLLQYEGLDYTIQRAKLEIEVREVEIEAAEKMKAITKLIKERGWEEWDMSEYVKNSQADMWMNFIGTSEDHLDLLAKVMPEQEKEEA